MLRSIRRSLGGEAHILTLLEYFRQAFCLPLAAVKPIAGLSRAATREVEDEALLDELLTPEILKHRDDWQGDHQTEHDCE